MRTVHAKVRDRRLVLDVEVDLPEGTEIDLHVDGMPEDDEDMQMTADEEAEHLARLDAAIDRMRQGDPGVPAEESIRRVRARCA